MALTAKKVYAILKRQISDMEAKLNSPVRYRGTVATADLLPLNPDIGDMYNIESKSVYGEAGMNVAWNGVVWDTMGAPIDMSLYLTKEETEAVIQRLVTEYFEKNPVKPGATTEQAQQIEQNKKDVASLKEDISTKITKFYASSQGETHLADSDNGKIQDMMVYGRSEQKQYNGCQLIDFSKGIYIKNATGSILNDAITVTGKNSYSGIRFPISLKKVMGNKIILTAKKISRSNSKAPINIRIVVSTVNRKEYIELSKAYDVSDNVTDIVAEVIVNNNNTGLDISNTVTVEGLQLQIGSEQLGWEPYTGGIPSPSPDYPQEIKSVVNPTVKLSNKDGTQFKTVTLPYTLNAIPVSSGGNVTIDGQQYIADYVDAERGKLVRMVGNINFDNIRYNSTNNTAYFTPSDLGYELSNNVFTGSYVCNNQAIMFNALSHVNVALSEMKDGTWKISDMLYIKNSSLGSKAEYLSWFNEIGLIGMIMLAEPEEINLTPEEIAAFKALATYYPTTNISINSEQLDGYTVFNYPISMKNGWDYVKKQLNDNRDYIYNMDTKTQDIDTQAAEAYVNSEYAVALTELEV
jgi:hypothetical protein